MIILISRKAFVLINVLAVILLLAPHTSAQETLSWKTFQLAGYYNESSQEKGIADKILKYYITKFPEYAHDIEVVPIARLFNTMANTTEGGYLGPGKTRLPPEQMKKVLTSTVHFVMPPPGIVIRKVDLDIRFSGGQNLSLQTLLKSEQKLTFCWIRGATYHPNIRKTVEEFVAKHGENHPNLYFFSNIREGLLQMLILNRIDYFPNHALPFQYEGNHRPEYSNKVMFLQVNEAPDDVITYTFAANTPTGREVIKKVNAIHASDEYKTLLKKLIPQYFPSNLIDTYIRKNMELVGTNMK